MSTPCLVTPGRIFSDSEPWTPEKLNQLGNPTVEIEDGSIGKAALNPVDVRDIVTGANGLNFGRKNALINGGFDVWQRGITFNQVVNTIPFNTLLTADRWGVTQNIANRLILRAPFGLGQTLVPGNPNYALRWLQTGALTINSFLSQRIEDAGTFSGLQATYSFYIYSSIATDITLLLIQYFGSGGAPSAAVFTGNYSRPVPASTWTRISATFDVPSVAGKAVGTDLTKGDWLDVRIGVPLGVVFDMYFANAQFELGDTATPFEKYNLASELLLCQRYYEVIRTMLASALTDAKPVIFYKATKRYSPPLIETLGVVGDVAPFPSYFTALDAGTAYQSTAHAQVVTTQGIDAELSV